MLINALNTLEIRLLDDQQHDLEQRLHDDLVRLHGMPGCLGYGLTRGSNQPGLWILSGYWSNSEEMTAHFSSEVMAGLIDGLIGLRAQLNFATYVPVLAERQIDGA